MLPNYYKFHIVNNTGQTIEFSTDDPNNSFTITAVPWKFDADGAVEYGSEITLFVDPTSDLTDGSSLEASAEINNTVGLYIGLMCFASLVTDAVMAADGSVDVFWEWSTDGAAGTFPSDSTDFIAEEDLDPIRGINTSTSASSRSINFRL